MVVAVIQARMGSSRLKGKTLMSMAKYTLLETVINSVKRNTFIDDVIVATSINPEDDEIQNHCEKNCIKYVRGDSENVLSRFITLAKMYNPNDTFVRITADNPLNNRKASKLLYDKHNAEKNDYTYVDGLSHIVYEFVRVSALLKLSECFDLTNEDKEHVTIYFRKNKYKFKTALLGAEELGLKPKLDKLLTVDSIDDYNRYKKMITSINIDNEVDFNHVYKWLKKNHYA